MHGLPNLKILLVVFDYIFTYIFMILYKTRGISHLTNENVVCLQITGQNSVVTPTRRVPYLARRMQDRGTLQKMVTYVNSVVAFMRRAHFPNF